MSAEAASSAGVAPEARAPRRDPGLPTAALAYVLVACVAAAVATLALDSSAPIGREDLQVALLLAAVAAFAQLFVVVTPLNQSYHLTPGIVLAAAILLPPELVAVVVVCQHVPEWVRARYPWFIQTFNIANFTLAALAAGVVFDLGTQPGAVGTSDPHVLAFAAGLAAALVFVVVQHGLLAGALRLARGHSVRQSGLFTFSSLSMDFVLTAIGVVVAELWSVNPLLSLFALSPLFLLHRTLALPKLQAEARQDPKTELYNARHFAEALDEAVARAERLEQPLSVLVADLDLLRDINNRYGHLAGDAVLGAVARVLREHTRPGDVAARFGGEEFCVLLVDTPLDEAVAVAERIRRGVEAAHVDVETAAEPLRATVSIGTAAFPVQAVTAKELLHAADVAAYRAKAHGRNRVVAFGAALEEPGFEVAGPSSEPGEEPSPGRPAAPFGPAGELPSVRRTAAPPAAPNQLSPSRAVGVLVGVVALAGVVGGVLGLVLGSSDDVLGIAALALLVGVTHALTTNTLERGSISVSAVGSLSAAAMFGARAALPLAIAVCAAEWARNRQSHQHVAFNCGALTLSALASAVVFGALPEPAGVYALLAMIAGAVYFAVNVGLVSLVISLETAERWLRLMQAQFAWLFAYYLLYGVVAAMLALAYNAEGILGLLVFAAPLALLRKAQRDYLRHTEATAAKLRHAAETIEQQNDELRRANGLLRQRATDAMASLAAAIDARDAYTAGHSRRVQQIAVLIAEELGLAQDEVDAVSFAALFHDVGKLGVPDEILLKDGPLDEDDWESIRRHPEEGARIIAHLGFLADSIPAIRHHHERYDGSGYPDGLVGDAIPIGARILHVADAFDSMLSARPYRSALEPTFVLDELRAGVGSQFCHACVAALGRAVAGRRLDAVLAGAGPRDERHGAVVAI